MKPLYAVLSDSARKYPNNIAIHYQGRDFTFAEVDDISSRFAGALLSLGVKRGDRVAIILGNVPQYVFAFFGTLKVGAIVVNNNPLYKEKELEHQLNDAGAEVVVVSNSVVKGRDLFESVAGCRGRTQLKHVITTGMVDYGPAVKRSLAGLAGVKKVSRPDTVDFAEQVGSSQPIPKPAEVNPVEDVAVLQYTGGTTGVSKGAMLTHYNLYSNAVRTAGYLPVKPDDVALAVLPLFHIYGLTTSMTAPFYAGSQIVLLPTFHVEEVMKTIQQRKVTVFCGVPSMYIAVNSHPKAKDFNLRSIRGCMSGGSALPVAVRKKFIELTGGNLVEGYGLSETSPVTHCNPLSEGGVRDGSIGIPYPDTDAKIVDLDNPFVSLPVGQAGELAISGPQVMKGYWNNQAETAAVLHDGWFLTGDIARMDEDGYFYVVDRKKDMVNVGGMKVYPRDVEEVLFQHPGVKEAAVIGVPDEFSGEVVKAFVVPKDGAGSLTEKDIIDFCASKLVKYKVPRQVEFASELPKTLIGKVLRRKLRELTPQQS
ncbi:MAG TPA: long-chain fatty acid--CoA ligase [Nitrososphaerales archaeon]|nr:long-chain fatty acid--CoA ligase [Nitrososphaerales archaeon]